MKRILQKTQSGDVSLFVILMMVSIMSIIMTSISNRSVSEINLSRQTFLGLQALQAANAGVELWLAEFRNTGTNPGIICEGPVSTDCPAPISANFFTEGNVVVTYTVEPITSGTSVERVLGVGTAQIGTGSDLRFSVTRSLEVEF